MLDDTENEFRDWWREIPDTATVAAEYFGPDNAIGDAWLRLVDEARRRWLKENPF